MNFSQNLLNLTLIVLFWAYKVDSAVTSIPETSTSDSVRSEKHVNGAGSFIGEYKSINREDDLKSHGIPANRDSHFPTMLLQNGKDRIQGDGFHAPGSSHFIKKAFKKAKKAAKRVVKGAKKAVKGVGKERRKL